MITKKVFQVLDMHCSSCAMRLEGLEDTIMGVKRISASYQKGQMQVEYDETIVSDDQILAAVKRLGYQAKPY
jgi:copper chaperone CopZ